MTPKDDLPIFILDHYEVHEWRHACAVLLKDFYSEWCDIVDVLKNFRLLKSDIVSPGGSKSNISKKIDSAFYGKGWKETKFETSILVDKKPTDSPTHNVDCFKNKVALEIEWNNKDPFFDRDLNNFRLLFDLRVISVGVIITRSDSLKEILQSVGRNLTTYGESTTHMRKLLPKIEGGGGGGCPILVFGIMKQLYIQD